jgi:hypothetical protein
MGIRIDRRRPTVHPQNVTALTNFLAPPAEVTVAPESTLETTAVPEAEKAPERPKRKTKRKAKPVKKRKR